MKRFYKAATIEADGDGFVIRLDGRAVRTPARALLLLPTRALAEAVAAEWAAQEANVRPDTMPLTRLANTAIDRVAARRGEVIDEVAAFGGSDLLCYRTAEPDVLAARQDDVWTPFLDWARDRLGAPLAVTRGIMPVRQSEASLAALRGEVAVLDTFRLTALHALVHGFGSLVLGLAALHRIAALDDLWAASRLDETFQAEEWGIDDEAAALALLHRADVEAAARLLSLLAGDGDEDTNLHI